MYKRFSFLALAASLLLAGCGVPDASPGAEDEPNIDRIDHTPPDQNGADDPVPDDPTPEEQETTSTKDPPNPTPPPSTQPTRTERREVKDVRNGPTGDIDLDGIPDALENSLANSCTIAGRTCAELGIQPPTVGKRDFILVQQGRSGTEQNWRLNQSVWDSFMWELANLSILAQVADIGVRDDINATKTWSDPANDGKFWFVWVIYDDPAAGRKAGLSGSQKYNLITLAERDTDEEARATILHEAYHAMLGNLRSHRSACADEEIGGPGHSSDPNSVVYTSPDCETNDGTVYRLGEQEKKELEEEPFETFKEMNEPGWTQTPIEA